MFYQMETLSNSLAEPCGASDLHQWNKRYLFKYVRDNRPCDSSPALLADTFECCSWSTALLRCQNNIHTQVRPQGLPAEGCMNIHCNMNRIYVLFTWDFYANRKVRNNNIVNLEPKGGIHEPVPFTLPHRKEVRASTECKKNSDPWSSSPELQQQTYKIIWICNTVRLKTFCMIWNGSFGVRARVHLYFTGWM